MKIYGKEFSFKDCVEIDHPTLSVEDAIFIPMVFKEIAEHIATCRYIDPCNPIKNIMLVYIASGTVQLLIEFVKKSPLIHYCSQSATGTFQLTVDEITLLNKRLFKYFE